MLLGRMSLLARGLALIGVAGSLVIGGLALPEVSQAANTDIDTTSCDGVSTTADYAKRYKVFKTDELQIVYVDGCGLERNWEVAAEGKRDFSLWQPKRAVLDAYPGFRSPGDLAVWGARGSQFKMSGPQYFATILVKDLDDVPGQPPRTKRLANATSFRWILSDEHTGGNPDVSIYEPICPTGFVPLGQMAWPGHPRNRDDKFAHELPNANKPDKMPTCFAKSITFQMQAENDDKSGEPNGSVFSTKDLEDSHDSAFYRAVSADNGESVRGTNNILLPPPTFWATRDTYERPKESTFRGIRLPMKSQDIRPIAAAVPTIKGPSASDIEQPKDPLPHESTLSAFVVKDDEYKSDLAKFIDSPVYRVFSTSTWDVVGSKEGFLCTTDTKDNCSLTFEKSEGVSSSTTWNNTVGVAASASWSVTVSGAPLGVGVEASASYGIELSYSHEFGGDSSRESSESTAAQTPVAPGSFAVQVQRRTKTEIYRHNDAGRDPNNRVRPAEDVATGPVQALIYPAQKAVTKDCAEENADPAECGLPSSSIIALPSATRVYSESDDHYLFLSKGGALEVRDADTGESQDAAVWSLDQVHEEYGSYQHPITSVTFTDGQLIVRAVDQPDWYSTTEAHPGAKLEIDPDGNLRIVRQVVTKKKTRTEVVWNSKADRTKDLAGHLLNDTAKAK